MKLADRVLYEIAFACDFVPELRCKFFQRIIGWDESKEEEEEV